MASLFSPIAIVGQSCLLPDANDPAALWQLVSAGASALKPVPARHWRADKSRMIQTTAAMAAGAEGCVSDTGGVVEGFGALWDPTEFDVDSKLLADLDPLVRWLLYTGREALRSAGIAPKRQTQRIGAIVGNLGYPSQSLVDFAAGVLVPDAAKRTQNPLNRFAAGYPVHLLCDALGLGAGGYTLDAACASSLYAIKLACDWLHSGRADTMLAGAVNRADGLLIHAGFTALHALSPSGRSRPFHRDADGLVPSEGAALLVLKRLEDAVRAGDNILGVIRGVGLSNDGRGSGMLVPSTDGQVRAMSAAFKQSGLKPEDISLVECHATGTTVGDATEIASMSQIYGGCRDLAIGSLKANMGHLITASGAASIIKILRTMREGMLPPTPNAFPLNGALGGTPFRVLEKAEAWRASGPRRAAISSFGFGGNNAHLLLEEWKKGASFQPAPAPNPSPAIAVVGMGAQIGNGQGLKDFAARLFGAESAPSAAHEIRIPVTGLAFPPRDLERALGQQLIMMRVADEALRQVRNVPPETSCALVGMQCDAEATRTVLRLALDEMTPPGTDLGPRRDAMDGRLDAARAVGCMPNILANRLNRQHGFGAGSFTLAGEEISGLRAVEIALDALKAGEVDAALVGAADLCMEPVHRAAATALGPGKNVPGDGACALVLKRLDDAVRDGDTVHAVIERADLGGQEHLDLAGRVRARFGHIHAASGLIELLAAILCVSRGVTPEAAPQLPAAAPRHLDVQVSALGGQAVAFRVTEAARRAPQPALGAMDLPQLFLYGAPDPEGLVNALRADDRTQSKGVCRLAVVAPPAGLAEKLTQARAFIERRRTEPQAPPPEGIFFRAQPVAGEIGFVFTGAAAAYSGMGRELVLALPELVENVRSKCRDLDHFAGWIYRQDPSVPPRDFELLCGSSFLCQVHAGFTRGVLGLKADAAIGLSSGETNSMFAFDAWQDMQDMLEKIDRSGIYTEILAGRADAVHQSWRARGIEGEHWVNYWLSAPVDEVRAALAAEPAAHITIINGPNDLVLSGEERACARVVARIGEARAVRLDMELAVHCQEVEPFAGLWRQLHHRPTVAPMGVRFYSNAFGGAYDVSDDTVADALTGQAVATVDFPRTIRCAWDDGVRVFIEHGPRGQCTQAIRAILGDRPHLAVALDSPTRPALLQALYAAAELAVAGVPVDLAALRRRLAPANADASGAALSFAAHPAPAMPAFTPHIMAPAPQLAPVLAIPPETVPAIPAAPHLPGAGAIGAVAAMHARMTETHKTVMAEMIALEERHRALESRMLAGIGGGRAVRGFAPPPIPTKTDKAAAPVVAVDVPRGPAFSRRDLETLASGRISDVLGPAFKVQDEYVRQVRMPEPPLLLADRVTGLVGEAGSMGLGTIWTETDVTADSWYLHQGHVPAGIAIEAGQADLLLISWLGADWLNRGKRIYRLLGCEMIYHGGLPKVGDTLCYDIHVDSHARHGDVGMFFFHYDCRVDGRPRMTMRNGQAGFFTNEELADSEGVLWSAETGVHTPDTEARRDAPAVRTPPRAYDDDAVRAFADGRIVDCFGEDFVRSFTHTRTPRIQNGKMQLIQRVAELDQEGGPWGRGYLRAEWDVKPDDWFFAGHFKNDPCMPGTLMFEGCLQAMAFLMTGLGLTLRSDGWRFEPVPDEVYKLRCRGQVIPSSRKLTYEVFVDEVIAGPVPTIYADVLCTVDGLQAFHCPRLGLRLTPDWPLEEQRAALMARPEPKKVASAPGIEFGLYSMLACGTGRPSDAFGPLYKRFDNHIRVPRLPGEPYHFMTRTTRLEGEIGAMTVGSLAEVEYDVPPDAWYFKENGNAVMPYCVLLEAVLQPCGWLASYVGTALDTKEDLFFRNLDGNGIVHAEVPPDIGTLVTRTRLTSLSRLGTTTIVAFKVECAASDKQIFTLDTVFGNFPGEALQNQVGLPPEEGERDWLAAPAPRSIATDVPRGAPRIGADRLRIVDSVSYWPDAGKKGLGRLRAAKKISHAQWFFKAHFFNDPVQPGSLGLEAMLQTLQYYMIETGLHADIANPRFEAIGSARPVVWKYRGQVIPDNKVVNTLMEIVEVGRDEKGAYVVADGSLWVDGKKIYGATAMSMRIVPGDARPNMIEETLDPDRDAWVRDHCPTYTVPVLPMMSVVDRLASIAQDVSQQQHVLEMRDVTLEGWISFAQGPRRLRLEASAHGAGAVDANLSLWRDAPVAALSRFEPMAHANVILGEAFPQPPAALAPLEDGEIVHDGELDLYRSGVLFHGCAFRILREARESTRGASYLLDAISGVPFGALNQALLDGMTHGIPNDHLDLWSPRIGADQVGYPSRVRRLSFYAPPPKDGLVRGEARFMGFANEDERLPLIHVQLIVGEKVWADVELIYRLFPKGPLGSAPPELRQKFLRERTFVPGLRLGTAKDGATCVTAVDVAQSDWLPGTLETVFSAPKPDQLRKIAVKEHVAAQLAVHPREIEVLNDGARSPRFPLTRYPLRINETAERCEVRSDGAATLDLAGLRAYWAKLATVDNWPIADLYFGLVDRFLRRVTLPDPGAVMKMRGRPALYLCNHQVGVESILFNLVAGALLEAPLMTIAKAEHRQSWIGQLIELAAAYPSNKVPNPILFFERSDPQSLFALMRDFRTALKTRPCSLMIHSEGTRALSCRTPVANLSSVFIDLALELDLPIIPVRFAGGLPAEPAAQRLEFPLAFGQQDFVIGAPIEPDRMRGLTLVQRTSLVLAAMNGLPPTGNAEQPLPAHPRYPRRAKPTETVAEIKSVLVETLRHAPTRSPMTEALLASLEDQTPVPAASDAEKWLERLRQWLAP